MGVDTELTAAEAADRLAIRELSSAKRAAARS
jgi:hypothetical protein